MKLHEVMLVISPMGCNHGWLALEVPSQRGGLERGSRKGFWMVTQRLLTARRKMHTRSFLDDMRHNPAGKTYVSQLFLAWLSRCQARVSRGAY